MKIYVLYDEDNGQSAGAVSALLGWAKKQGHEAIAQDASRLSIKPCLGCFACWLKTPGRCAIRDDDESRHLERFIASDLMVLVTKIPYGSYAPSIKRVLDRSIPSLLPYFKIYRGEMHHVQRYPANRRILHLPYGEFSPEELKTFAGLARAHCDNAESPRAGRQFAFRGEAAELEFWLDEEVSA